MAEEKSARVPQYRIIELALEERIRTGAFSFGEPLCTESALMAEFGSSRITVRRALEELENKGYITRKRGIGCFVSRTAYETLRAVEQDGAATHGQSAVYALLFPQSWKKSMVQALFAGACEAMDAQDAHAVVYLMGDKTDDRPSALLGRMAGMDIAGAAVAVDDPNLLLTEMNRLLLQGKAVVTFDGASALPHISSMCMDRMEAAQQVIAHLTALGHERIAWFGGSDERGLAEHLLAMAAHGLSAEQALIGRASDAGALRKCIAAGATAMVVKTESDLQQLARELTALGLHVPGNMSLCCMEVCAPLPALRKGEALRSVTCVQGDYTEMGRRIAQKLLQEKQIAPAQHETIAAKLHIGTTTAAVPEKKHDLHPHG